MPGPGALHAPTGIPPGLFVLAALGGGLPRKLEEAARLDGAGQLGIFAFVMPPLVKPAVAMVVITQFGRARRLLRRLTPVQRRRRRPGPLANAG